MRVMFDLFVLLIGGEVYSQQTISPKKYLDVPGI